MAAEKSDLFDVLAHIAYATPPLTREERAAQANLAITAQFTTRQRQFLDLVLSHYVTEGVEELREGPIPAGARVHRPFPEIRRPAFSKP